MDKKSIAAAFTESEPVTIFEAARIALADGEIADRISEDMDLGVDELHDLSEKLAREMNRE